VDVPISIISVTDGVMGMGFGGVLLDREDAVMVVDRQWMTSIVDVMIVGYNFLG
jgi:hypothetical protein